MENVRLYYFRGEKFKMRKKLKERQLKKIEDWEFKIDEFEYFWECESKVIFRAFAVFRAFQKLLSVFLFCLKNSSKLHKSSTTHKSSSIAQ